MMRLNDFIVQYTVLARQIVSSNEVMSIQKIDEFTDKLIAQWETMPESLQFNEIWVQPTTPLPEWPLGVISTCKFTPIGYTGNFVYHIQHYSRKCTLSSSFSIAKGSNAAKMTALRRQIQQLLVHKGHKRQYAERDS